MDDTRDIAIEARASSSSAHKRLDSYKSEVNGQILRLARAVETTNEKLDKAVNDPDTGLRAEFSTIKTELRVHAVKLTAIVAGVAIAATATTSVIAQRFLSHHPAPTPQQTAAPSR